MKSSPIFVVAIGVARIGWDWKMSFLNQADSSTATDDTMFFNLAKGLYRLEGEKPIDLWAKLVFGGTDGAAAIRSTQDFRGIFARLYEGKSFFAHMWRDPACGQPFAVHCIPHQGHLCWGTLLSTFLFFWLKMLQGVHGWFKMSPKRKKQLIACGKVSQQVLH